MSYSKVHLRGSLVSEYAIDDFTLVDFYDPNSELVQDVNTAHCDVDWRWDGTTEEQGPNNNFSEGFVVCSVAKHNLFQVQIARFHSASNWSIIVSHKYRDDV